MAFLVCLLTLAAGISSERVWFQPAAAPAHRTVIDGSREPQLIPEWYRWQYLLRMARATRVRPVILMKQSGDICQRTYSRRSLDSRYERERVQNDESVRRRGV